MNCRNCLHKIVKKNKYGNFFSMGCGRNDCLVLDGDYARRNFWKSEILPDFIEAEEMTI